MIGVLFAFACLVDGLVTQNPDWWAPVPRAILATCCFVACLAQVWRYGVRVQVGGALMAGLLAALAVSDFANAPSNGRGLATFVLYAAFLVAQLVAWRDWSPDLALAGALLAVISVMLFFFPPPEGAWNRNVIGGILAVLLPPAYTRWGWRGATGIFIAILATGSRGAWVAGLVGLAISARAWRLFSVVDVPMLTISALGLGAGLVAIRPETFFLRFQVMRQAVNIIKAYPLFGVGAGRLFLASPWSRLPEVHAHNSALSVLAQVGIVGACIIAASVWLGWHNASRKNTGCHTTHALWQIATLAAMATHSLIDDPLAWLPVGVIASIALAGERHDRQDKENI